MAEEKENGPGSTTALIILGLAGLGVIATAMILVYRMAQKSLAAHPFPPPPFLPEGGKAVLDFETKLELPPPAFGFRGQMADTRTYSVQADSPVRIATSYSDRATVVTLRAIHPPGTWAAVATSMAVAQQVSGTYPTGSVIVLPVGGAPQEIMLTPGEALFAKASQDNVLVSVSTAEANV